MRDRTLGTAVGAFCIIAGCSDERMRLLAESGRKSQFYYSPSSFFFRKRPLRFHAARFPKVHGLETEEERKTGSAKEDVVNPTVKSSFCWASAS